MSSKNLIALIKKREALEAEIAKVKSFEKRKTAILEMSEFSKIAGFDDAVLRVGFAKIWEENAQPT